MFIKKTNKGAGNSRIANLNMSSFKKSERNNIFALEDSVINDPPEEVARVYNELGEVPFTARALGIACRFRDLETVKALVENGASFKYDEAAFRGSYRYFFIEYFHGIYPEFQNFLIRVIGLGYEYTVSDFVDKVKDRDGKKLKISPDSERVKIVDYLCKNAEKTGFDPGELLYYLIITGDRKMVSVLKQNGITLSENKRKMLVEKGGAFLSIPGSDKELMKIISALRSEVGGEKLHITSSMQFIVENRFSNPELFNFFLENFDFSNVKKGNLMKEFILQDNAACLEITAELGWLKQPKKRDELIAFAAGNGSTECTAFLLDYKNRTADFAAEQMRAEKKAQRELNADPNSVTELKKIWSWEKHDDGTLVITGYKGKNTEVTVPEKLAGDTVTAIGECAFSPDAKRIRAEQRELRKAITEVKLPDTITKIGDFAFFKCRSLTHFDIPPKLAQISKGMLDITGITEITIGGNVKKIGAVAFYYCSNLKTAVLQDGVEEIETAAFYNCGNLEELELPKSLKKIVGGKFDSSFYNCYNMTVTLYKGSYAEQFCIENNIQFKYKE